MEAVTVRVDGSGRVVIPRDVRIALGIPDGGELRLTVEAGELRAISRAAALRRIWAETGALPPAPTATETLFALRRAEARGGLQENQAPAPTLAPTPAPSRG
jgi:AbrB family looped-hinge helix DNA binding protein